MLETLHFKRIALALGYRTWDVGTKNEEKRSC